MEHVFKPSLTIFQRSFKVSTFNHKIRSACTKSSSSLKPQVFKDGSSNSQEFCINHVKKYDRENYLAALCIKEKILRRFMFALRAFNVELSLVRDSTTNTDRAKVRFHFWSKLVEEIVRRNGDKLNENPEKLAAYYNYTPVAKELLDLFYLLDMDDDMKKRLNDLIGARVSSKVLGYKSFDTMDELELYCSKSNGSIYHLASKLTSQISENGGEVEKLSTHLSENLGKAHGLSIIIRGILYNSTKNCCYIPADLLASHHLTSRDFVNRKLNGEKISPVVEVLASRCQYLTDQVQNDISSVSKTFNHILLPRVPIQAYLRRLKKCNYNVCHGSLNQSNGLLPLNIWLSSKYSRMPLISG